MNLDDVPSIPRIADLEIAANEIVERIFNEVDKTNLPVGDRTALYLMISAKAVFVTYFKMHQETGLSADATQLAIDELIVAMLNNAAPGGR